jgi:cytochrome b
MTDSKNKILVWDAPVRVFHWLLALSFAGAYLTAESERWRLLHMSLGYTMGGLVTFRILWGLLGTRYARFTNFVQGPAAVMRYLRSLASTKPEHHIGHNPAGALAIVLLLLLSVATVATGWTQDMAIGGHWLEEFHEGAASFMLALVGVHLAGVVLSSWLHRENLVRSMLTGQKAGAPHESIRWSWRPLALLLLVAVLGFWWWQWQGAPASQVSVASTQVTENAK